MIFGVLVIQFKLIIKTFKWNVNTDIVIHIPVTDEHIVRKLQKYSHFTLYDLFWYIKE